VHRLARDDHKFEVALNPDHLALSLPPAPLLPLAAVSAPPAVHLILPTPQTSQEAVMYMPLPLVPGVPPLPDRPTANADQLQATQAADLPSHMAIVSLPSEMQVDKLQCNV